MGVQGGLLLLIGIPSQEQIRLHLRDLLFRKLKEIHLPVNQAGVYHCNKRILFLPCHEFLKVIIVHADN